jgi:peptidoglycan/LPS O-acetylase OafA/YrhL
LGINHRIIGFSSARFKPLDGLRGVAVLLVILFHYINNQLAPLDVSTLGRSERALMKVTYFGWCGVDLFFVLSGFLIGRILMANRGSENYFKAFYVRRFLRIIPVYYLLLIIFMLFRLTSIYDVNANIFHKPIPIGYYFAFVQNYFIGHLNHFGPEALTPTWSLAVEEQFYLLIPLIVYLVRPRYLIYVVLFMIALAPISRSFASNWYQEYTYLINRIDSPAFGFLLAWLLNKEACQDFIKVHIRLIQWGSLFVFIFSAVLYVKMDVGVFNHTIIAANFTLLLLIVLFTEDSWIGKMLSNRILMVVGVLSYFLYLFHQIINGLLHHIILRQPVPVLVGYESILVTLGAMALTFVLAVVSYRYIEKPLIKYSHSYSYR